MGWWSCSGWVRRFGEDSERFDSISVLNSDLPLSLVADFFIIYLLSLIRLINLKVEITAAETTTHKLQEKIRVLVFVVLIKQIKNEIQCHVGVVHEW